MKCLLLLSVLLLSLNIYAVEKDDIQLIVRVDDLGATQSFTSASLEAYRQGIATSAEVIVPGPWFLEAARLLKEVPNFDVGVHLTLTSEWRNVKWGPITRSKSLSTENGYFPLSTQAFSAMEVNLEEVEAELRAQIELAKKYIPQLSHLSTHMGTATSSPELKALTERLAEEYNLPLQAHNLTGGSGIWNIAADKKTATFHQKLTSLTPGTWMIVTHPAHSNDETLAMQGSSEHDANVHMAAHRSIVLELLTSKATKDIIHSQKIKLIGYDNTFSIAP